MTATHGPGRVPGVRRLTDAIDRLDARDGAQEARTGREGSGGGVGAEKAAEGHVACEAGQVEAERRHASAVVQLGTALVELAKARRQRDEAVKAFQRERARVGRVEALAERLARIHNRLHEDVEIRRHEHLRDQRDLVRRLYDDIRAALADRPTDDARKAREAAVSAADDAGVAGQGSDAERAGEGHA